MSAEGVDGRRELNRARTRAELSRAAWDIVRDDGFEGLTADAVAERAGVSRRTFFNYFPRVELVLHESLRTTVAALVERVLARPADEPLRESLLAVLSEPFSDEVLSQAALLCGHAERSPAARAHMLESNEREVAEIAGALRARLGESTDPLFAEVVARAATAAGHAAIDAWVDQTGGVLNDETRALQLVLMRRAFEYLSIAFSSQEI